MNKKEPHPESHLYSRGWDHGFEAGYAAKHKLISTRLITRRERDAIIAALRQRDDAVALTDREIDLLCDALNQDVRNEQLVDGLIKSK